MLYSNVALVIIVPSHVVIIVNNEELEVVATNPEMYNMSSDYQGGSGVRYPVGKILEEII